MNAKHLIRFVALLVLAGSATSALAGWEVTYLHPAGQTYSRIEGISGGQQVGCVNNRAPGYVGYDQNHAALWSGTSGSFVDLNPAGVFHSYAHAVSGGQQVGETCTEPNDYGYMSYAALWSGTSQSYVNLNPAGSELSSAYGISGGRQVGWATVGGRAHAGIWSGTAASWVDLHPAGVWQSEAEDISDGQQVGHVRVTTAGPMHASLWSGTAGSWVDLHPGGDYSGALAVSGGQQAGFVKYASNSHAALWSGTAASFVDLHPAGSTWSVAHDVAGGWQVGYVNFGGRMDHAGMWSGTAESWVDLHGFLPGNYSYSSATSIEATGNDIWIAGSATNSTTGCVEAVMWHNVVPEPSSLLALGSGLLALGGLVRRRR